MDNPELTLAQAAKMAMDLQDACNLSAIVHTFSRVMDTIWNEADKQNKGTDWVNTHPIVLLFISKLSSLSRYEYAGKTELSVFGKAWAACELLAKEGA